MNKTLVSYLSKDPSPASYTLQMLVNSLKQKCERLIEFENYLDIKKQLLNKLFEKYGKPIPPLIWQASLTRRLTPRI